MLSTRGHVVENVCTQMTGLRHCLALPSGCRGEEEEKILEGFLDITMKLRPRSKSFRLTRNMLLAKPAADITKVCISSIFDVGMALK